MILKSITDNFCNLSADDWDIIPVCKISSNMIKNNITSYFIPSIKYIPYLNNLPQFYKSRIRDLWFLERTSGNIPRMIGYPAMKIMVSCRFSVRYLYIRW